MRRPDLDSLPAEVRAYIEWLEAQLPAPDSAAEEAAPETEPPTPVNLITLSANGFIKRTPRHLYGRQKRGGMGVFDLDLAATDQPQALALADLAAGHTLVLFTNQARTLRLAPATLPEAPVHAKGQPAPASLRPGERLTAMLTDTGAGRAYFAVLSAKGWVRVLPATLVTSAWKPEMTLFNTDEWGPLVAATWTQGGRDLLILTRHGLGLRFPERAVLSGGSLGIRLEGDDAPVALLSVNDDSAVVMVGADGKGTVRHMRGFAANKAPGAGGKTALKTEALAAAGAGGAGDVFLISRLGKLIRFALTDIPAKEGVVQGVNCMALRADEVRALTVG